MPVSHDQGGAGKFLLSARHYRGSSACDLASCGDQDIVDQVSKLDALQQQQRSGNLQSIKGVLEFGRGLLELFRDKFDFLGHQEFEELARLRSDRNQCAQPTFSNDALPYAPAAELAAA